MNYLDILKDSKAHRLNNCYTFINKEKYLYDHTLERMISDYLSPDLLTFNYVNIDAATSSYDSIYSALITLPVMSDYKITVIDNLEQLNLTDKERDQIVEMGLNSQDQICIFVFNNKKSKIYNLLKRKKVEIIEFTKLSDVNFKKWVSKKFIENGKKIIWFSCSACRSFFLLEKTKKLPKIRIIATNRNSFMVFFFVKIIKINYHN